MSLTPKNWYEFQHYKDRAPVWIKLHRSLLDNYEFHCLPIASRALAPLLWLLASEYEGGKITATWKAIAFRLHMSVNEFGTSLMPLIESGFFVDDSNSLADRYQDAIPEKETYREETEIDISSVAKATRPRKSYSDEFEEFWKAYPRTPTMSKTEAWKQWGKLTPDERTACISAVPSFIEWARKQRDYTMLHACRFISQKRFEGFREASEAKTVKIFEIHPDDMEWALWWDFYERHKNPRGQSMGQQLMTAAKEAKKPFVVKTPYPPDFKHQEHAA